MKYIAVALSSLMKRKLTVLFIIIQLVISFWMINNSLITMEAVSYQEKKVFSASKMDKEKTLKLVVKDGDDSEWFATRFYQLEDHIKKIKGVVGYGAYNTIGIFPNKLPNKAAYLERNKELYAGTRYENYIDGSQIVYFDSDIYKYSKFSVIKGRPLSNLDFNKKDNDIIPVLVGFNYGDVIKIGDRFESHVDENVIIKYEVIGVLEKGSEWLSGNDYIFSPVDKLDNFFVSPYFPAQRQGKPIDVAVRLDKTFIQLDSKVDYNRVATSILEKGKELGINPSLRTIGDDLNDYRESRKQIRNFTFYLGMFFLVMSVIGVVSVTLSSINARKYELGVRMVTGASKSDISLIILIELITIVSLSAVIGVLMNYIMETRNDLFEYNINLEMFTYSLYVKVSVIAMLIIISSIIIPLYKIRNLQLRELIGGKE